MAGIRKTGIAGLLLALIATMGGAQAADDKPLWEIGAGVAAFSFPSYRGSDQTNNFLLPVPHFTYHGDFLKADRHGIRGSFFDSDRLDLTVSAALSPPANSDDIAARSGMPDLKATFEIGPQIDLTLWRSANRARFVKLLLPVRAAFTVEGSPRDIGWVVHPKLNMDVTDIPDVKMNDEVTVFGPENAVIGADTADSIAAKTGTINYEIICGISRRVPRVYLRDGAPVRIWNDLEET